MVNDDFVAYAKNAIARLDSAMAAMRRKPSLFDSVVDLAMAKQQIYNMASAANIELVAEVEDVGCAKGGGRKSKYPWDDLKAKGDRFIVGTNDDDEKRKLARSLAVAANQKFGPSVVSVLRVRMGVLVVRRR